MRKHPAYQASDAFAAAEKEASFDPKAAKLNETVQQQSIEASVDLK